MPLIKDLGLLPWMEAPDAISSRFILSEKISTLP